MIDALDSFEEHFRRRVVTAFPTRKVMGIMDAQDWPPETVELEAFYILSLGDSPVAEAQSAAMPVYVETVQISWIVVGADINSSMRGRNRGNRYRANKQIKKELLYGLFPYFTEKKKFTLNPSSGVIESASLEPEEFVIWSKAQFSPAEPAKDSGVIYGIATVYIANMTDEITS